MKGKTAPAVASALLVLFVPHGSRADDAYTLSGDAGGARLMSQPQSDLFGTGASVAIGVYRPVRPSLLAGLRLRMGVFADGPPPADKTLEDPGAASSVSALLALRWRPLAPPVPPAPGSAHATTGLWAELGLGGGLDGRQVRPMAEVGVGWGFGFGSYVVSPMLRYQQVVQSGEGNDGNDAKIVLFGVEVTRPGRGFGGAAEAAALAAQAAAAAGAKKSAQAGAAGGTASGPVVSSAIPEINQQPKLPRDTDDDGIMDAQDRCPGKSEDVDGYDDSDGCPDDDNDDDGVLDLFDKCRDDPETINGVNDEDGCPDTGLIELVRDRIVLEDRIMFQTGRSQLSAQGRKLLEAVARLCRQHLEWELLAVEGHTDARGTEELNQKLSEERANGVRRGLIDLGFDEQKVTARGFGATRPRVRGDDENAHQRNRRVELVVIKKRALVPTDPAYAGATPASPGGPTGAATGAPAAIRPAGSAPSAGPGPTAGGAVAPGAVAPGPVAPGPVAPGTIAPRPAAPVPVPGTPTTAPPRPAPALPATRPTPLVRPAPPAPPPAQRPTRHESLDSLDEQAQ